jgi:hypothetical protein
VLGHQLHHYLVQVGLIIPTIGLLM